MLICEKLCYGRAMSDHGYRFYAVNPDGNFTEQAFEVFSYPMGDITVRQIPDADPVEALLQVPGRAVDWTRVREWSTLAERLFPRQSRVLALPYLPSARGDKDVPSP